MKNQLFSLCFVFISISLFLFSSLDGKAQPKNDSCANAITLSLGTSCNMNMYSTLLATDESNVAPIPSCGFYVGGDVWFKVKMPVSGAMRVEQKITSVKHNIAIYSGVCGNMKEIDCMQFDNNRTISRPDLAGQMIYIRIFQYYNTIGGTFELCVWEPVIPSNNNCGDAIPLNVGQSCHMQQFTNAYATGDTAGTAPKPSCGFYRGGDVWFTFQMPFSGELRVERKNISTKAQIAVYSGVCGAFIEEFCMQLDNARTFIDPSLAGQTLYMRVYSYNSEDGGEFELCLFDPVVPVNNECANAIPLNVGKSCNMQKFTNAYATGDAPGTAPKPSCGFYRGGDVWFSFLMPVSGELRVEKKDISTKAQIAVYSGVCGSFTQEFCMQLDNGRTFIDPSLAGQTLYMRVYSYNSEEGGEFELCLYDPDVPINNECANPILLKVGQICKMQKFTNAFATGDQFGTAPKPSCGFYRGGDVWFKFTMPASGELRVEKNNISTNAQIAVYSGVCGSFTEAFCMQLDDERTFIDHSLAGQTLYMRVYSYNSEEGGEFELCLFDPDVPVNNNCADAIPLAVQNSCNMQQYTNAYATADSSGTAVLPGCGFYKGGDVWFTIDMPPTGKIQIMRNNISGVNAQFALYAGTCGSFAVLDCAQLSSSMKINDTSLAGQTLYLRVYNYNNEEGGIFELCVVGDNSNCEDIYEEIDTTICFGESITVGGSVYNTTGIYQDTLSASTGCDSIITTNLIITPQITHTLDTTICDGDSITINGSVYTHPGIYKDVLTASNGCDSVVIINITFAAGELVKIDTTMCPGDTLVIGGSRFTGSGVYKRTLTGSNGCDSVITIHITENDLSIKAGADKTVYYGYPDSSCTELSVVAVNGGNPPYKVKWSTGDTMANIKVCPTVTTTFTVSVTDKNGCTVTDEVKVCVIDVRCGNYNALQPKVQICHTKGKKAQTLCVSLNSVAAHLAHGDLLGNCNIVGSCNQGSSKWDGEISNSTKSGSNVSFEIYPNPFRSETTVSFKVDTDGLAIIELFDVTGKKVEKIFQEDVIAGETYTSKLSVETLSSGLYFCKLRLSDGSTMIKKVIYNSNAER